MKRKEQNRAAQRAFRERKEKHVKDVSYHLVITAGRPKPTLLFSSSRTRLHPLKLVINAQNLRTRICETSSLVCKKKTPSSRSRNRRPSLFRCQKILLVISLPQIHLNPLTNHLHSTDPPPDQLISQIRLPPSLTSHPPTVLNSILDL